MQQLQIGSKLEQKRILMFSIHPYTSLQTILGGQVEPVMWIGRMYINVTFNLGLPSTLCGVLHHNLPSQILQLYMVNNLLLGKNEGPGPVYFLAIIVCVCFPLINQAIRKRTTYDSLMGACSPRLPQNAHC